MSLYMAVLFFLLVPGVLVTLPPGGKKMTVAFTHAVVFALVYYLTHKAVYRMLAPYEAFQDQKAAVATACTNGKCVGGAKANATCTKTADC
jgi:hypothetical protein